MDSIKERIDEVSVMMRDLIFEIGLSDAIDQITGTIVEQENWIHNLEMRLEEYDALDFEFPDEKENPHKV